MNATPKFFPPLWGDLQGNLNSSIWPAVTQAWHEKRYLECFYGLLDYINPALRTTHGNTSQTEFHIPHGSVVVNITLQDNTIEVNCPMVDITDAIRLPLFRKATELNFYPLSLAQMRLNGSQLSFHYTSTLDTCEPFKTYYALKEICQTADRYDDEFKEKFKAKSLVPPKVKMPSTEQTDLAWDNVNAIIKETFDYLTYFDAQRWYGTSLDFLVIALKRIDLCAQIQGFLKNEIERIHVILSNNNLTLPERTTTAKKFLQQIQQMGKDAFAENLYEVETFVPEKWRLSAGEVKTNVTTSLAQVQKFYSDRNFIAACIESYYCIYDLFYKNNMENGVNNVLIGSLANAAGKSWQDSSAIMMDGMQTLVNTQVNTN